MSCLPTVRKRAQSRSRLYLRVKLKAVEGDVDALVRDISRSGALVESLSPPPVESEVRLVCGRSSVSGRVAWRDSTWFGIRFDKPLVRGSFLRQAQHSTLKVSAPRSYRRETVQDIERDGF